MVFPDVEADANKTQARQVRQKEKVGWGFLGNGGEAVQAIEACEVLPRHVTEMCDSTNSIDDDMMQQPYSGRMQSIGTYSASM
jgi:hypothetical protein